MEMEMEMEMWVAFRPLRVIKCRTKIVCLLGSVDTLVTGYRYDYSYGFFKLPFVRFVRWRVWPFHCHAFEVHSSMLATILARMSLGSMFSNVLLRCVTHYLLNVSFYRLSSIDMLLFDFVRFHSFTFNQYYVVYSTISVKWTQCQSAWQVNKYLSSK